MKTPEDSRMASARRQPLGVQLTLTSDGRWPVSDVRELRDGVAHGLATGQGVQLDLSGVDEITSTTVATILWARRSCALRRLDFSVVGERGRAGAVLRSCGVVPDRSMTW